jgi:galactokinase/mevalonate kinase-like predicted kinase
MFLSWFMPGMDLLGGGGGGVLFFMIKQKRQNEINNIMISE